jgi:hypothetical protein
MEATIFFNNIFLQLFGKEKLKQFENKLLLNEFDNIKKFFLYCSIEGIILLILGMLILFYANFDIDRVILLGGLMFFLPFFLNYLYQDIKFENNKKKKEIILPELLLETSVFFDNNNLLTNIKKMSEIDLPFNKDFKRVLIEINNGSNIVTALNHMKELNQSKSIDQVVDLFLHYYETGCEMDTLLKDTATDLLENNAIIRERQAIMLVTKYTLFLACGLIVPCVLGLIIGLVNGLNFGLMGELEIGLSTEARKELFNFAVLGANIYIIEFALLSSFFLGIQDNNKKQFWIYALILVPIALVCFFTAQSFI